MIESAQDREFALRVSGEPLAFFLGEVKAIPCDYSKTFNIERDQVEYIGREYYWLLSQADIDLYDVQLDSEFQYVVENRSMVFKVTSMMTDASGWLRITCNLKSTSIIPPPPII